MGQVNELIVDAYECSGDLSDLSQIELVAREALEAIGATIVGEKVHGFQPHGLTLCFILKESHFVLSTWPEHKLAICNIFLCNESMNAYAVWEEISKRVLMPKRVKYHEVVHALNAEGAVVEKIADLKTDEQLSNLPSVS